MGKITVIGGINIDVEVRPEGQISKGQRHDSSITMEFSGTGMNIVRRLAALGEDVAFVSLTGSDFAGRTAVSELRSAGVDVSGVCLSEEVDTGAGISVIDIMEDPEYAFYGKNPEMLMDAEFFAPLIDELNTADIVAADGGLTAGAIGYLLENLDVPVFFDPMSIAGAERARDIAGGFTIVKPNRIEAEAMTGMQILSEEQLEAAGSSLAGKGISEVFITLGAGGVYYRSAEEQGTIRPGRIFSGEKGGTGDAFSAALLSARVRGMGTAAAAEYAMSEAAAAFAEI